MNDIHSMVTELTRPHLIQSAYETDDGTRYHYVRVPALLAQLEHAAPTSSGTGKAPTGGGTKSQAPSHLEALDTIQHIDRQASAWVRHLGDDDPSTTIACVTRVGALAPSVPRCHRAKPVREKKTRRVLCCAWHTLADDIRQWWTQARVVAGIDEPSWRPDNTCPLCGKRGGLRVNREAQTGVCVECRETWAPETIGLLAEHIRAENADFDDETGDAA